ncbi:MAG: dTDP-4-dehydrorhamnose reductase [Paracoccaceae bacterium]|nr:dTDP-4-dehydrorhamnose reductase [Paracoccaceae bacterium]
MILVFGKTGQVATELRRLGNVLALGRDQADLSDPVACGRTIRDLAPLAVINAAAYTAVDKAEEDEELATIINGDTPTAIAQACVELKIPSVHISTDYVFEGSGEIPWKPSDAPNPQNAYGRSKLVGEEGIRTSGAAYAILRTSWVVSAHGTNFAKTMLRLSETRDALNIVEDQIGGPTPARDIAVSCLIIARRLREDPSKSGTYHFSGAPDVSWADFASEIFAQAARSVTITPIPTAEYPTPAKRPLNSRMDCSMTNSTFGVEQPDWRIGLKEILNDLGITA